MGAGCGDPRRRLRAHPGKGMLLYNLACCEAQLGRLDAAIAHLGEALADDPRVREWSAGDADLDPLRDARGLPALNFGQEEFMADYTKLNIKRDVEDMAPKFQLSPGLESRFARRPLELENSGVSYYKIAPDFRTPFGHRHGEQEEVYIVISGNARLKLEDEVLELEQWDAVRIPGPVDALPRGRLRGRRGARVRRPQHRQQGRRDGAGLVDRLRWRHTAAATLS